MEEIISKFRENKVSFDDFNIDKVIDYQKGIDDLPKSNVIKIIFKEGHSVVVRPSGTEPKIKIYFSVVGKSAQENEKVYRALVNVINEEVK